MQQSQPNSFRTGPDERGREADATFARETIESGIEQGRENLPCPVGPEVGHQQAVAVAHAVVVADRRDVAARRDAQVADGGTAGASYRHGPIGARDGIAASDDQREVQ